MITHPIDRLANVIRHYSNGTNPDIVAAALVAHLSPDEAGCAGCTEVVSDIIRKVDPDQTLGADALAEAVWGDLTDNSGGSAEHGGRTRSGCGPFLTRQPSPSRELPVSNRPRASDPR